MNPKFKKNRTTNGSLRTPVVFFSTKIEDGLDGRDVKFEKKFSCFAQIYNPSMKDIEISQNKSMKASLTLKIRDPQTDYFVDNRHVVEVSDKRVAGRKWDIIDFRPDFENNDFIVIVVGSTSNVE